MPRARFAGSATTYRVTGAYLAPEVGGRLHSSVGTGFRAPSLAQINYSASASNVLVINGVPTPNEARTLDNRPPLANGDVLYIQGATVPLGYQTMDDESSPDDEGGADEPRNPDTDSDA